MLTSNRSIFIVLLTALFLLNCKEKSTSALKEAPEQAQPNLLFIFPDQFRNAAIGINHQDPVQTPNLDKLAGEGMIVSNAISSYPLCSPYRGMLMTGLLPYHNTVLTNSNSQRHKFDNNWQKDDVSFSDVLVKNGYDAGYVGKLHLRSPAPIEGKDSVLWDAYQQRNYDTVLIFGTPTVPLISITPLIIGSMMPKKMRLLK